MVHLDQCEVCRARERMRRLQGTKQEWVNGGQALDGNLYGAHVGVMEEICQCFEGLGRDYEDIERVASVGNEKN